MSHVLPLLCALAVLAGVAVVAGHGGDRVSFVELGAAAVSPHASVTLPG